jgi:guanylate kinase
MPYKQPPMGNLFIIAAPSGAGKSSLVDALLGQEKNLRLSISYTTRPARPGETNGEHYHFVTVDEFLKRQEEGEFLEYAQVHSNYYGTSHIQIHEAIRSGIDILLEIDWQGAQQVRRQFPNTVGIFILPPSIPVLEERLKLRGQDEPHVITHRILAAGGEIAHASEFEYVIINDVFESALSELAAIVKASRCRFAQQLAKNSALFSDFGIHAH